MKRRSKEVRMGVRVQPVGETGWEWTEDGFEWAYDPDVGALNLSVRRPGGVWQPCLHVVNLAEGVMFSCGYAAGWQSGQSGGPHA